MPQGVAGNFSRARARGRDCLYKYKGRGSRQFDQHAICYSGNSKRLLPPELPAVRLQLRPCRNVRTEDKSRRQQMQNTLERHTPQCAILAKDNEIKRINGDRLRRRGVKIFAPPLWPSASTILSRKRRLSPRLTQLIPISCFSTIHNNTFHV